MTMKILIRDSLSDDGSSVTTLSYSSPDIIVHSQVAEPKSFFTSNYYDDCNEKIGYSNDNYIYVRVRNIGDITKDTVYINLYVNQLSLYLNPLNWQKNRIKTIRGNECSEINMITAGEISATEDYFVFNRKTYNNNCFVAVAGDDANPDFTWIDTWSKYVHWVTENPNVAARNMVTYTEKEKRQYEEYINIINPYQQDATFAIIVTINSKVPLNTHFGVESSALNIDHSLTYVDELTKEFSITTKIKAGTDNYLRFYGSLSKQSEQWPEGAVVSVKAILIQFGIDVHKDTNILKNVQSDKVYRNGIYHFNQKELDGILNENYSEMKLKSNGPVFGLCIGECGIRYK